MGYQNARFAHRADLGGRGFADLLKWRLGMQPGDDHASRPRWESIPVATDTLDVIGANGARPMVTWFGHASALIRLNGVDILVDPVEGSIPFVRRESPDARIFDAVPKPAAILVTHNHFDHMDATTLEKFDRATPMIVPLGMGEWFTKRGYRSVKEMDWWESVEVAGLDVKYLPARHWSKRTLFDTLESLWGGYIVQSRTHTVYHAGDSGYFGGFAEIGKRFSRIDVALMPIGAYSPRWFMEAAHMDPADAIKAMRDVKAAALIPIHYGSFRLSDEPMTEPPAMMELAAREAGFDGTRLLPIGGTLFLD
ncbi:MAG: MBL fold metallo-hydrolase [Deltaproteobacteria bacterium]|nr:MBL fold metallo-hydrolase [Deltaproteobacteria bacterium]